MMGGTAPVALGSNVTSARFTSTNIESCRKEFATAECNIPHQLSPTSMLYSRCCYLGAAEPNPRACNGAACHASTGTNKARSQCSRHLKHCRHQCLVLVTTSDCNINRDFVPHDMSTAKECDTQSQHISMALPHTHRPQQTARC